MNINGTNVANKLIGTNLADTIRGYDGSDSIWGNAGDDYLDGGLGNDFLYGGLGNDFFKAGAGDDYAEGGDGNDSFDGGAGADTLIGGLGNDIFSGEDGNDIINGGDGHAHRRAVLRVDHPATDEIADPIRQQLLAVEYVDHAGHGLGRRCVDAPDGRMRMLTKGVPEPMQAAGMSIPAGIDPNKLDAVYGYALDGVPNCGLTIATQKLIKGDYAGNPDILLGMTMGTMYVTGGATVAAGDPVYYLTANGRYTNVANAGANPAIPNAFFEEAGTDGAIVQISLGLRHQA